MKALQWQGVNKLAVGEVPDPEIRNAGDIIVKVNRTVTCGSDLHLIGGYIPFMEKGDVLAAAGADVLHASQRHFADPVLPGSPRNLAGWARHLTGLPSITVGSVGLTRDFVGSDALRALVDRVDTGEFDLVALGRILLRNPAWVTLAAAGRVDEIHDYRKSDEDTYF